MAVKDFLAASVLECINLLTLCGVSCMTYLGVKE